MIDRVKTTNTALVNKSVMLAEKLMLRSRELETKQERKAREQLNALVCDPEGVFFSIRLLDRAFRPRDPRRAGALVTRTLDPLPSFLSPAQRFLLRAFQRTWKIAPSLAIQLFVSQLRRETQHLILKGESRPLQRYLATRRAEGVQVNLNLVGEAVLSATEAENLIQRYEKALGEPHVEAVAVKLSSIVAQTHPLASDTVVDKGMQALRRLYRAAKDKLVTLDMEEYDDLDPTVEIYSRVLLEDEFLHCTHGIALQAYLPDSLAIVHRLADLGAQRTAAGGAPLRLRLVKGANLATEALKAAQHGWSQAPFPTKADVDANMKILLHTCLEESTAPSLHVGAGSHNVFDIAYALTLAQENGTLHTLTIEMLEGMANPLRRAIGEIAPKVLVYAPIARSEDFLSAIAYLTRRFDENTQEENFLRHAFSFRVGDHAWQAQEDRFRTSCERVSQISHAPRRGINRTAEPQDPPATAPFTNAPDTDWASETNRKWAHNALATFSSTPTSAVTPSPEASWEDIAEKLALLQQDPSGWADRPHEKRKSILQRAAAGLRRQRATLLAVMAMEAKKTFSEADPEISEAIDFAEYYARALDSLVEDDRIRLAPRGVVAVFPPWNFPLAIPIGGICAALVGGNRVIVKPSPFTPAVARTAVETLWKAGVPKEALAFVHCDAASSAALAQDENVDAIVFTGSTSTAEKILLSSPTTALFAETGGKNATIVTATADRDLAIQNLLRSCFGHAGQKCSATSLVVLEKEIYDDLSFQRRFAAAVRTLRTGPATDPATDIPPLVPPPNPFLEATLRALPDGERWLIQPEKVGENHWAPGIVWDVQEGSPTHTQELFGPVIGVARATDLDQAIGLVHARKFHDQPFGLTSGLESLDPTEWRHWRNHLQAGNLYINRPTVGAVVMRQPFGGWGKSCFGPGAQAGGPQYAAQLVHVLARDEKQKTHTTKGTGGGTFSPPLEAVHLPGQRNIRRFLPAKDVVLRLEEGDDPAILAARQQAAATASCDVQVSLWNEEPVENIIARLSQIARIVCCGSSPHPRLQTAAASSWTWMCTDPLTATDRDQLPFLVEQTTSADIHRHGWTPPVDPFA